MPKKKPLKQASTELISGEGFDDDCPICQALKLAERQGRKNLTEGELKKALEAAKKIPGAIVRGNLEDVKVEDMSDDEPVDCIIMKGGDE